MTKTLLKIRIPSYESAEFALIQKIIDGFVTHDPMLGDMPIVATPHRGPVRITEAQISIDYPMSEKTTVFSVSLEDIKNNNIDKYIEVITEYAQTVIGQRAKFAIDTVIDTSQRFNSVVDMKGESSAFEIVMKALETLPLEFDEDGSLTTKPNIFVNPLDAKIFETQNPEMTPEQKKRYDELLEKKRAEFTFRQRKRRLN